MSSEKNLRGRRLISHTSIYMLGDILRYSVSLVMLPIYTRYLTPEDYGVVELLQMLIDFAAILFGVKVAQSVFRFFSMAKTAAERNTIIASALFLGALFDGIGAGLVASFSESLSMAIFSDVAYAEYIVLFAVTMFLIPLNEIPLIHIRALQKPWLFFAFSGLKLVIQVVLNIYFVVIMEMHVAGVVYSTLIASTVMAILLTGYSVYMAGFHVKFETCKTLFMFSLPLKFAAIGTFYLAFGDRYILNMFTDLSQVGIYALGYKFGFIFTLIAWMPFEKMWDMEKYQIYRERDAIRHYQKVFLYISSFLVLSGLCISLFSKDLLRIMSDQAFWSAYEIVPVIIIAYLIQAWTMFCNLGILIEKQTLQVTYAEIIAVIVITIAYFTLIPLYGLHGAAWATVIGFSARFYWINMKSRRLYDMQLPWGRVGLVCLLAVATFAVSLFVADDILMSILARTVLVIGFIAVFFMLPILSSEEKNEVWALVLRKNKKISTI